MQATIYIFPVKRGDLHLVLGLQRSPPYFLGVGYHLLYLTPSVRVSQGKHAHLHKYAVKHTLVAPALVFLRSW